MTKFLLTLLLILAPATLLAQQAFSSLEEQMNSKEFKDSGLEKLSQSELDVLNNWIRSRSLVALDIATPVAGTVSSPSSGGDQRGFETKKTNKSDRVEFTSQLVGAFTGWDGHTTFKLENGMVWQQADKDKFYTKAISSPLVTIKPGAFGTWRLSVEGHSSRCKVKRLQ
jgi:hypothetical protein